ncbi:MAG TPA: amidohydrolase family protein [Stellaceae bacterium]|jgi:predicted TIM-barrel fold metal-dependent hydrolase|nr:amidohydrolase family protein [Stellaceae bacterium]
MSAYKLISADSHIVEPPDMYTSRIHPGMRDRAPRMERRKTPGGREYDAWMLEGAQVGTLGAVMQAGQRFEDPSQIDFLGIWEDVRKGAYDADAMLRENEEDGIWGSVLQPSQGLFWYRVPDSALLTEICRCYNDWIAEFCQPHIHRLKGIAMLNVDDVDEACQELERCAKLGLVGAFIPVAPRPDAPYRHAIYDRLWWTAQDLKMPLLLHIGTPRDGVPGNEFTTDVTAMTGAGRSTTDYWVRYSLSAMLFAGVFDRYPGLQIGSVEHEASWIPHWLKQMDFTYTERPVFTKGWKSREGMLPSDYWRRNMFVEFMEDDIGVKLREYIGVENMLWGSDYPHAEATFPRSQQFLQRMFAGVPDDDLRKITSENAAKKFGFSFN